MPFYHCSRNKSPIERNEGHRRFVWTCGPLSVQRLTAASKPFGNVLHTTTVCVDSKASSEQRFIESAFRCYTVFCNPPEKCDPSRARNGPHILTEPDPSPTGIKMYMSEPDTVSQFSSLINDTFMFVYESTPLSNCKAFWNVNRWAQHLQNHNQLKFTQAHKKGHDNWKKSTITWNLLIIPYFYSLQ